MLFIKAGAKTPNIFFINDEYVYAKSISDAVSLYKDKIAIYNEISSIIPVIRYTKELQHSYIIINDDNHVENDNYFLYKFELPTDYPGSNGCYIIYYIINEKDKDNIINVFIDSIKKVNDKLSELLDPKPQFVKMLFLRSVYYVKQNDNDIVSLEHTMIKE